LAGILVAALFQILLSPVQGLARWQVYLFWTGTAAPETLKAAVYSPIFSASRRCACGAPSPS